MTLHSGEICQTVSVSFLTKTVLFE